MEDFDRLSRMGPWDAMPVFQEIINAGITVVTLKDREVWHRDALRANPFLMMKSLFAMWNGHQESVKKSSRVAEAYAAKRRRLVSGEKTSKPYKRTGPAWLRWDDKAKAFIALAERAKIVQEIFAKADGGTGLDGIARGLNTRNVPTWGEGKRKAAFWRGSYIRKILTNRAAIGVFTPHVRGPTMIQARAATRLLTLSLITILLWTQSYSSASRAASGPPPERQNAAARLQLAGRRSGKVCALRLYDATGVEG